MLDSQTIFKITQSFYDKANHDVIIGYHFRVIDNFEEHIPRIAKFWELQLNATPLDGLAPFNLIKAHSPLGLKKGEFGRWQVLFEKTLNEFVKSEEITEAEKQKWISKITHFKTKLMDKLT